MSLVKSAAQTFDNNPLRPQPRMKSLRWSGDGASSQEFANWIHERDHHWSVTLRGYSGDPACVGHERRN
jgi:hypothetical protein